MILLLIQFYYCTRCISISSTQDIVIQVHFQQDAGLRLFTPHATSFSTIDVKGEIGQDVGDAEIPVLLPPQRPFPPVQLLQNKRWGRKNFYRTEKSIEMKILRNSVTLSFMLIHFSTDNLFLLLVSCRSLEFQMHIGNINC